MKFKKTSLSTVGFLLLIILSCKAPQDKVNNEEQSPETSKWSIVEEPTPECDCFTNAEKSKKVFSKITYKIDTINHTLTVNYDNKSFPDKTDLILKVNCQEDTEILRNGAAVSKEGEDGSYEFFYQGSLSNAALHAYVRSDDAMSDVRSVINSDSLEKNLKSLYGVRQRNSTEGLEKLVQTKQALRSHFMKHGLSTFTQKQEFPTYTAENIIGKIIGSSPDKVLIMGAHFDTVEESPGADDNASGIAAIMEMVRVLSQYRFEYTIVFVGFDLEEEQLLGSDAFVNEGAMLASDSIIGYINLDMIGYSRSEINTQLIPDDFSKAFPHVYEFVKKNEFKADFLVEITNVNSRPLAEAFEKTIDESTPELKFARLEVRGNGESSRDLRFSDHSSFWDAGYPSISLGDGANTRNPHYHSSEDKLQDININFMKSIVQATAITALKLAKVKSKYQGCLHFAHQP